MGYAKTINRIAQLYRQKWGDNAVEALVGLLSTVTTEKQLQVLIRNLEEIECQTNKQTKKI